HELARLSASRTESHPVDDVVQPRFEEAQQILTGRRFAPGCNGEITTKLTLEDAIGAAQFLFLAQLIAIVRHPHPRLHPMLSRFGVEFAFRVQRSTCALQEKVGLFPARKLALRSDV